jgi:GTPase SAR1 family protein
VEIVCLIGCCRDIAGQERFGAMTRVYYKEAVAAIVVFDITNRKTFGAVDVWIKDVNEKLNTDPSREPIPIMLVANKTDLLKERPACIDDAELDQYVTDMGIIGVFKTSAKDNDQIGEAMKFLVTRLRENEPIKAPPSNQDTFQLHAATPTSNSGSQQTQQQGTPCCR